MPRLTIKQRMELEQDNTYVKISFRSSYSQGSFILKTKMYELKIKQIKKTLKGLYYFTDYRYIPTYEEYCNMDSFLNTEKSRLRRYEYLYENTFDDREYLLKEIKEIKEAIIAKEHELLEEYDEKFHPKYEPCFTGGIFEK